MKQLVLMLCILVFANAGVVQEGLDAIGQELIAMEEKMKTLQQEENQLLDTLDSDIQDIRLRGLHKDMVVGRRKIREERQRIREIEREKRKTLAMMYRKLRTVNIREQERLVRKLGLMNRLRVNHLAILGVNEDIPVLKFYNARPNALNVVGGDYLMKDDDDVVSEIDMQKLKMKTLESKIGAIQAKYSDKPTVVRQLVTQIVVEYNNMLNEMIYKMQRAVAKKQRINFKLRRQLDARIDALENKMELMTPEKRNEAIAHIKLMRQQRDRLAYDCNAFRKELTKLYAKLERNNLINRRVEKKAEKKQAAPVVAKKTDNDVRLTAIEKELMNNNGLLLKVKGKVTKKLMKKQFKGGVKDLDDYMMNLVKYIKKEVIKTARNEVVKSNPITDVNRMVMREIVTDKVKKAIREVEDKKAKKYIPKKRHEIPIIIKKATVKPLVSGEKNTLQLANLINEMKNSKMMVEEEITNAIDI